MRHVPAPVASVIYKGTHTLIGSVQAHAISNHSHRGKF